MAGIDLRPMTLGEVLDRTFTLYKGNFWLFAGIFALPYLATVAFSTVYSVALSSAVRPPGPHAPVAGVLQALGALLAGTFLMALVNMVVIATAWAATVVAVSDLYLGRAASLRGSYARIRGRILPVILVGALTYLMVGAGTMLFVIPGIVLLCRTALAVPAATLEDIGAGTAISRSFRLTKDSAWGIFAVYLLIFFLVIVSSIIFHIPYYLMTGSPFKPHALSAGMRAFEGLSTWVSGVIVGPIGTIAFSLIYYNQRVRKEAFDLEQLMASLGAGGPTPASP